MNARVIAIAAFLAVAGLLAYRATTKLNVPGAPDQGRWVMKDFRDAIYCPVVTFLAGRNPYDPAELRQTCAAGNSFPLYAPHTLVLHLPFGMMPLVAAELLYFLVTVALTAVVALLAPRACGFEPTAARLFGLGAALLASRPGHWNLLLGQY